MNALTYGLIAATAAAAFVGGAHEIQNGRDRIEASRVIADNRCDQLPEGVGGFCYVTGFDMDEPLNRVAQIPSGPLTDAEVKCLANPRCHIFRGSALHCDSGNYAKDGTCLPRWVDWRRGTKE